MNETLYEIAFYSNNNFKTSLTSLENMVKAKSVFLDTAKTYLHSLNDSFSVIVCDEENPDIKRQHETYPANSFVLCHGDREDREDYYDVFEKKNVINEGYVWNSESFKVRKIGYLLITEVKLSPNIVSRFADLNDRENNLEIMITDTNQKRLHAIKLMRELNAAECEAKNREAELEEKTNFMQRTKKLLVEWEADLELWEADLKAKEEKHKTDVTLFNARTEEFEISDSSEVEVEVVSTQSTSLCQISYLDELKRNLAVWGTIQPNDDDTIYRDHIENTVLKNKKFIVEMGKVKED